MSSSAASDANSLRVIVGPTAAGKSSLALALAEEFGGAIVSADSRQIYRDFDIGTAKPSAADRARAPHFGIDVASPADRWSAARFSAAASEWIVAAERDGRVPVVVGGTGFWVSALIAPLAPVAEIDDARRSTLAEVFATMPDAMLREWCAQLDPGIAHRGPAQWRRAIEVALLTGKRLSDWHRDDPGSERRSVRYLLVDPGEALEARIANRIGEMLAAGWIDEVHALMQSVPATAVAWKACGYERLRRTIASGESLERVNEDVRRETRQYARRQRTWFRRQLRFGPVTHLDPGAPDALARARAWWQGEDST